MAKNRNENPVTETTGGQVQQVEGQFPMPATPEPRKVKKKLDPTIQALARLEEILCGLDEGDAERCLRWLNDKFLPKKQSSSMSGPLVKIDPDLFRLKADPEALDGKW